MHSCALKHTPILLKNICIVSMYIRILFYICIFFYIRILFKILILLFVYFFIFACFFKFVYFSTFLYWVRWNRMFLCLWNRICIFLGIIFNFYFNLHVFNSGRVVLQKRQVIATSLGCRCRHSEGRWDGGWQKYGYGIWKYGLHTKPRWVTDVEIHEGRFVWWWCWWWEWCLSENAPCHQSLSTKAKTHQPEMALGDVMCGFPGFPLCVLYIRRGVWNRKKQKTKMITPSICGCKGQATKTALS